MAFLARVILVCAFAFSPSNAAEPFLQKQAENSTALLNSVEAVLGVGTLRGRVQKLQGRIQPLYLSLPKNNKGKLSHAAARYALHRIIVDMHGWSIEGLEPNVSTYNTTSLAGSGALRAVMPAGVQSIFEDIAGTDGFTVQELAVLASTIVHGVHEQQQVILRRVCQLFDLPTLGAMSKDDMRMIIQQWKAVFLIGGGHFNINLQTFTASDARRLLRGADRVYPGWADALLFIDDEIESLAFNERSTTNPFHSPQSSLQVATRVVEKAADHFARNLAELECQEIREDLLAFESADTGRVRLADFYRAGLTSRFFYVESKEYLQAIGALDDSDLLHGPKVIVSNYVLAKANCLAHSNAYSVCCINECDALYEQLENNAVGYESTPDHVASVVSQMSSSTVQAPRNLSKLLLRRLEEIASGNGGTIMLHSRLFGQWMHQAFPRECAYPHLMGTTTSLSPRAWSEKHGIQYRIDHVPGTRMEVLNSSIDRLDREYLERQGEIDIPGNSSEDLMWTSDEETFVVPRQSMTRRLISMLAASESWLCVLIIATMGFIGAAILTKAKMVAESTGLTKVDAVFV